MFMGYMGQASHEYQEIAFSISKIIQSLPPIVKHITVLSDNCGGGKYGLHQNKGH